MPDMEIMQYINIFADGVIHESMRRKSALERINMRQENIFNDTMQLLSQLLDNNLQSETSK